jgi:hypothetical protein
MTITYGDKKIIISNHDLPIKITADLISSTFGSVVLNGDVYTLYASKQGRLVVNKPIEGK